MRYRPDRFKAPDAPCQPSVQNLKTRSAWLSPPRSPPDSGYAASGDFLSGGGRFGKSPRFLPGPDNIPPRKPFAPPRGRWPPAAPLRRRSAAPNRLTVPALPPDAAPHPDVASALPPCSSPERRSATAPLKHRAQQVARSLKRTPGTPGGSQAAGQKPRPHKGARVSSRFVGRRPIVTGQKPCPTGHAWGPKTRWKKARVSFRMRRVEDSSVPWIRPCGTQRLTVPESHQCVVREASGPARDRSAFLGARGG
jgi:hypothetical protein